MTHLELAATLGIDPDWAHKALRILESHGLVDQLPHGRWAWKRFVSRPMTRMGLAELRDLSRAALTSEGRQPATNPEEDEKTP